MYKIVDGSKKALCPKELIMYWHIWNECVYVINIFILAIYESTHTSLKIISVGNTILTYNSVS